MAYREETLVGKGCELRYTHEVVFSAVLLLYFAVLADVVRKRFLKKRKRNGSSLSMQVVAPKRMRKGESRQADKYTNLLYLH